MAGKLVFAEIRSAPGTHLTFISDAVQNKYAISYYTDAAALSTVDHWLPAFPQIMPMLNLHSETKAPGNILYYMAFIHAFGYGEHTAFIAGVVMGAISTLGIPACYWFLRTLLEDEPSAFLGACFLGLCPGFVLFFPASDPSYVILSCLIGVAWILALKRDRVVYSIATGVVTAVILLISFNLLVFGMFLAGYSLLVSGRSIATIAKRVAIALSVCVLLCGALWLWRGYDPIATFESAWRNQHALLAQHADERPYPTTIWNDLLDFALGTGWISFLLTGFTIAASVRRMEQPPQPHPRVVHWSAVVYRAQRDPCIRDGAGLEFYVPFVDGAGRNRTGSATARRATRHLCLSGADHFGNL